MKELKITKMALLIQFLVLAHMIYIFWVGQHTIVQDSLFVSYVLGSAYYWKRYARFKKSVTDQNHKKITSTITNKDQ